jgi:hypothetical protein
MRHVTCNGPVASAVHVQVQSDGPIFTAGFRTSRGLQAALAKMSSNSLFHRTDSEFNGKIAPPNSRFRVLSLERRCVPRMNDLAQRVVHKLKGKKIIFTSVESCTGGLIAHLITNVGGAAQVFWVSTFRPRFYVEYACLLAIEFLYFSFYFSGICCNIRWIFQACVGRPIDLHP